MQNWSLKQLLILKTVEEDSRTIGVLYLKYNATKENKSVLVAFLSKI